MGFDRWQAKLDLAYAWRDGSTIPTRRAHAGPLRVQKHLYPEGPEVCQHIIVHPPGGIAGGDQLHIAIDLAPQAHALITSPGAAKWYCGYGQQAGQHLQVQLAEAAVLEWLPQETIVFDGAEVMIQSRFDLAETAQLFWLDVFCLGRPASGELFQSGRWWQNAEIYRAGRPVWLEQFNVCGGDPLLDSPIGLAGDSVLGNLIWVGAPVPEAVIEACRALVLPGRLAISQLPDVCLVRYLGSSAEAAQAALRAVWRLLRPAVLGREAIAPRIWAT